MIIVRAGLFQLPDQEPGTRGEEGAEAQGDCCRRHEPEVVMRGGDAGAMPVNDLDLPPVLLQVLGGSLA